jgi:hypothetical protein
MHPLKHPAHPPAPAGFKAPPKLATPGRTQPTPSASRSVGAELTGVAISIFGIRFTSSASVNVERDCPYSSLPSKQLVRPVPYRGAVAEGFRVPPIPATPGRTQPTPSASRSVGAELTGTEISILGISCSVPLVVIYYFVGRCELLFVERSGASNRV